MRTPGLRLVLGLVLGGALVAGCREEKTRPGPKPGPGSTAPTKRAQVKPKIQPYKVAKEESYVRRAVQAWSDQRARAIASGGGQAGFVVVLVDSEGPSGHRIVVREEVRREGQCSATLSRLKLLWSDPSADGNPAPTVTELGADCCGGRCDRRPSMGWQVQLLATLNLQDLAALRELVDPRHGVRLVVNRGDDDNTWKTNRVYRRPAWSEKLMRDISVTVADELSCSDPAPCQVPAAMDCFACNAEGGAYKGTFVWRREGPRAHLLRLTEERQ